VPDALNSLSSQNRTAGTETSSAVASLQTLLDDPGFVLSLESMDRARGSAAPEPAQPPQPYTPPPSRRPQFAEPTLRTDEFFGEAPEFARPSNPVFDDDDEPMEPLEEPAATRPVTRVAMVMFLVVMMLIGAAAGALVYRADLAQLIAASRTLEARTN